MSNKQKIKHFMIQYMIPSKGWTTGSAGSSYSFKHQMQDILGYVDLKTINDIIIELGFEWKSISNTTHDPRYGNIQFKGKWDRTKLKADGYKWDVRITHKGK